MLLQPIVINHWYFIRHLKRWMICANEISTIYGCRKAACARARQHLVFLLFLRRLKEKKQRNLRRKQIVFYVSVESPSAMPRESSELSHKSLFSSEELLRESSQACNRSLTTTTKAGRERLDGKFIQDLTLWWKHEEFSTHL